MKSKPGKLDKKHRGIARDAIEDIKDISGDPKSTRNNIRYMEPNRDRALGEIDRTGRHFDGDEGQEGMEERTGESEDASRDHEAD